MYGQQEFGNTTNGYAAPGSCNNKLQFWLLPVTIGDQIVLDWEIIGYDPNATYGEVRVLPVGTTDFNLDNTPDVVVSDPNSVGKNEIKLTAVTSGQMVLEFRANVGAYCGTWGTYAYDFTANVTHAVAIQMPTISSLRNGQAVQVGVHSPSSTTVSGPLVALQILHGRKWETIGSATVQNSVARVHVRFPRGVLRGRAYLRAIVTGTSYRRAVSRVIVVQVT